MIARGIPLWCMSHPIGTVLLATALVLLGLMAYPMLPVSSLPEAELPTIQIRARLPGASAETMASSVATPLEVELSAIPGLSEMTSRSMLGSLELTLQFGLDKPIDDAIQEVQAAINAAAGRLPADMPSLPTWRKVNPSDRAVLMLAVTSDTLSIPEISDYAETVLARQISRIEGVGQVRVIGQRRPAIRIQASPEALVAAGVTLAEVREAVREASVNLPKGALYSSQRVSILTVNDQIFTAEEYGELVVAWRDGAPVRLKDVARVQAGAEDDYVRAWPIGSNGVGLFVQRQPGANIVATVDRVYAALPGLQAMLPASIQVRVDNDRTYTIRASLHEVELTLLIAIALVLGVMAMFLRQLSATLIVSAVLGTTLAATGAGMYLAGFSLNNLTLVAIVVAVGFIVDDAIVVVENIHRHLEAGASRSQAAIKGMREISSTVMSIGISLVAAFIPLLFMGGVVGKLFREFALTSVIAILVSVGVSLTLTPTLASLFMSAPAHAGGGRPSVFDGLSAAYGRALNWTLDHPRTTLCVFGLTLALSIACFIYIPKGFFPLQDTGVMFGRTVGAPDSSFEDMVEKHRQMAAIIEADPAVDHVTHAVGFQTLSNGNVWVVLKDFDQREASSEEVIARLRPQLAAIPGLQVFLRSMQDINIGGSPPRAQYLYVLRGPDSAMLSEWAQRLVLRLRQVPEFQDVSSDLEAGASVTRLTVDRRAAGQYGLSVQAIDNALYDAFGQRQINEYQTESNQYKVILEIDPAQRGNAESLSYFHLRSSRTGEMVPLSAVVRPEPPATGLVTIAHDGMLPAANVSFNLAAGVPLGEAVGRLRAAEREIHMPAAISGSFQGTAKAFEDSLATQPFLILSAVVALYIILGVLYESLVHPLTILSTLPSAGIGALLSLWVCGYDFSIMALIGIILLIGIVKKNGILMIDFALDAQRRLGRTPLEAIREACLTRFRPILMTTLAAGLGAVPLIFGFGAGSEMRQPLGVAIVGGLALSQLLTLFTTPVIYLALDRAFSGRRRAAVPASVSGLA